MYHVPNRRLHKYRESPRSPSGTGDVTSFRVPDFPPGDISVAATPERLLLSNCSLMLPTQKQVEANGDADSVEHSSLSLNDVFVENASVIVPPDPSQHPFFAGQADTHAPKSVVQSKNETLALDQRPSTPQPKTSNESKADVSLETASDMSLMLQKTHSSSIDAESGPLRRSSSTSSPSERILKRRGKMLAIHHKLSAISLRAKLAEKPPPLPTITHVQTTSEKDAIRLGPSSRQTSQVTPARLPPLPSESKASKVHLTHPPWERSMDVVWEQNPYMEWTEVKQAEAFKLSLIKFVRDSNHLITSNMVLASYFRLPDIIRFRVCKYVLDGHSEAAGHRVIRLNRISALQPVWPLSYFDSLQMVLEGLEPYLAVSFGFRADLMAALFTTRHFHLVYSPFVCPNTSQAAVLFARRYAGLMQFVTLELDLTHLGCAADPAARALLPGLTGVRRRVEEFVAAQLERLGTMLCLRVLVRRYHSPMYSPNALLPTVLSPLHRLGGRVERVRVIGADERSSNDLVRHLWVKLPEDRVEWVRNCHRVTPSNVYPQMPGQASCLDYGPGVGKRVIAHPAVFRGLNRAKMAMVKTMELDGGKLKDE